MDEQSLPALPDIAQSNVLGSRAQDAAELPLKASPTLPTLTNESSKSLVATTVSTPAFPRDSLARSETQVISLIEERIVQSPTAEEAARWAIVRDELLRQNSQAQLAKLGRTKIVSEMVTRFGITSGLAIFGGYLMLHLLVIPGLVITGGAITLISVEAGKQYFSGGGTFLTGGKK